MKKGRYCILNKQYSKEEYEELVPKIIEHMKKHGEWGEWFSHELSPLGYNESVAQDLLPMTKEEVLAKGWKWYEAPEESLAQAEGENVVKCEVTERSFRLIPKELEFYKINGLPNPRRHPDQRHSDRLSLRNPYFLKESVCEKCGVNLLTDQSEDKVIYCEKCYLAEVY